jgi:hypothetical protein
VALGSSDAVDGSTTRPAGRSGSICPATRTRSPISASTRAASHRDRKLRPNRPNLDGRCRAATCCPPRAHQHRRTRLLHFRRGRGRHSRRRRQRSRLGSRHGAGAARSRSASECPLSARFDDGRDRCSDRLTRPDPCSRSRARRVLRELRTAPTRPIGRRGRARATCSHAPARTAS